MTTIDANNLAAHSDEMLRQIDRTGQPIDITRNEIIVARIIPVYGRSTPRDLAAFWSDWDRMSQEIGEELERQGVQSVDAVELMKDARS
jgi:antitoxin (DNA-binding transcriptional repressor) of toxin-antitoxin stability system